MICEACRYPISESGDVIRYADRSYCSVPCVRWGCSAGRCAPKGKPGDVLHSGAYVCGVTELTSVLGQVTALPSVLGLLLETALSPLTYVLAWAFLTEQAEVAAVSA